MPQDHTAGGEAMKRGPPSTKRSAIVEFDRGGAKIETRHCGKEEPEMAMSTPRFAKCVATIS